MQIQRFKATVATLCVSSVWAAGVASNVNALSEWTMLAGVGILGPLVMLWRWSVPRQSMADALPEAVR